MCSRRRIFFRFQRAESDNQVDDTLAELPVAFAAQEDAVSPELRPIAGLPSAAVQQQGWRRIQSPLGPKSRSYRFAFRSGSEHDLDEDARYSLCSRGV